MYRVTIETATRKQADAVRNALETDSALDELEEAFGDKALDVKISKHTGTSEQGIEFYAEVK